MKHLTSDNPRSVSAKRSLCSNDGFATLRSTKRVIRRPGNRFLYCLLRCSVCRAAGEFLALLLSWSPSLQLSDESALFNASHFSPHIRLAWFTCLFPSGSSPLSLTTRASPCHSRPLSYGAAIYSCSILASVSYFPLRQMSSS